MRNMRNVNLMTYCGATGSALRIEECLKNRMNELGYSEQEISQIQSQMCVICYATDIKMNREFVDKKKVESTCISVGDVNDPDVSASQSIREKAKASGPIYYDEGYYFHYGNGEHSLKGYILQDPSLSAVISSVLTKAVSNSIENTKSTEFKPITKELLTADIKKIIEGIRKKDNRFEYISFSRNFGKEIAIIAGLDYSRKSDAVIIMDADLQDPPELIPEMIQEWEKGYDDVYATRKTRDGETWLKKFTSTMYYKILQKFTKIPIQKDTGDFRLLDKRCVQAMCKLRETGRCSKSIFSWIGYNKKAIYFDRDKRIAGVTKWNYKKLIDLAIDGITSLSISPLRWPIYISFITFASWLINLIYVIIKQTIEPYQIIISLILFFMGIQFALIGILGEYIGRTFNQTKNRPLYLIDEINGEKYWENKDEKKDNNHFNNNYISSDIN